MNTADSQKIMATMQYCAVSLAAGLDNTIAHRIGTLVKMLRGRVFTPDRDLPLLHEIADSARLLELSLLDLPASLAGKIHNDALVLISRLGGESE